MAIQTLQRLSLFVLLALLLPCIAFTQDQTSLSELQKLKAENLQLKYTLANCNATVNDRNNKLDSITLSAEQVKLEKEFRETLHAKETDKFNWTTLTFSSIDKK